MKSKESKAILEVREWKASVYHEVEHLSLKEQIAAIFKMAHDETERYKKESNKQSVTQ